MPAIERVVTNGLEHEHAAASIQSDHKCQGHESPAPEKKLDPKLNQQTDNETLVMLHVIALSTPHLNYQEPDVRHWQKMSMEKYSGMEDMDCFSNRYDNLVLKGC